MFQFFKCFLEWKEKGIAILEIFLNLYENITASASPKRSDPEVPLAKRPPTPVPSVFDDEPTTSQLTIRDEQEGNIEKISLKIDDNVNLERQLPKSKYDMGRIIEKKRLIDAEKFDFLELFWIPDELRLVKLFIFISICGRCQIIGIFGDG